MAGRAGRGKPGAVSIALVGNAAEIEPDLVRRGEHFDVVTDQTSAHDALNGYVPAGLTLARRRTFRATNPDDLMVISNDNFDLMRR